jgi:hypothetical protein
MVAALLSVEGLPDDLRNLTCSRTPSRTTWPTTPSWSSDGELHPSIGLAIEELYADRLAERYEVLAHHFSKATKAQSREVGSSFLMSR